MLPNLPAIVKEGRGKPTTRLPTGRFWSSGCHPRSSAWSGSARRSAWSGGADSGMVGRSPSAAF